MFAELQGKEGMRRGCPPGRRHTSGKLRAGGGSWSGKKTNRPERPSEPGMKRGASASCLQP